MTVKRDGRGRRRDYGEEYRSYHGTREQRKRRAARNRAARKKKCPEGHEVDHIKPLSKGGSNKASNLRCVKRGANRRKGNTTDRGK